MTKSFAIALILGCVPFAAAANPMSVGGENNLLAAATVASPPASAGGSSLPMSDPGDDDAVAEPLVAPEPAARQRTRQPNAARASTHVPAHGAKTAHKKAETTRWQSLLPGVMK
ncbi:MAG: hypothetical protein JSS28_03305 [Proteobacteria bacterium]|nr:hypothetical protein [Pseudomonadota bacterium]